MEEIKFKEVWNARSKISNHNCEGIYNRLFFVPTISRLFFLVHAEGHFLLARLNILEYVEEEVQ